ncbi:MAG: thiamine-phosphate kinase [Pseudomonadota bacterium]|nr:thiamine-phosphate kinase [Pseudomonadota bacterium]
MDDHHPGEFALIREHFSHGFPHNAGILLGVGDDASLITLPDGCELAQSIDTQVAGIHFPATAPAHLIAQRALRCAVSDLAAMGAEPQGFHLALTLPDNDRHWLADFTQGLRAAAGEMNIALLGGDTTSGPALIISIQVQGCVPHGQALRRDAARVGDDIWVSGVIGASALALPSVLQQPASASGPAQAYYFPRPQLQLGIALRGIATACLDISDGLLQDAGHIARASGVSLMLCAEDIPAAAGFPGKPWLTCITGGDDYQLLFTAPAAQRPYLQQLQHRFPALRKVGVVQPSTEGKHRVAVHSANGPVAIPAHAGYQHF